MLIAHMHSRSSNCCVCGERRNRTSARRRSESGGSVPLSRVKNQSITRSAVLAVIHNSRHRRPCNQSAGRC